MNKEDFSDDNSSYWNTGVICFNGSLNDDKKAADHSGSADHGRWHSTDCRNSVYGRRVQHCKGRSGSRRHAYEYGDCRTVLRRFLRKGIEPCGHYQYHYPESS